MPVSRESSRRDDEVAERRARARALRQRARAGGDEERLARVRHLLPRRVRAEQREDRRDRGRIAELAEQPGDAGERDRREEIVQVGVHDDRRGRRAAWRWSPCCARATKPWAAACDGTFSRMLTQDPLLRRRELRHRRGEQPHAAAALGDGEADVVRDRRRLGVEREPAQPRDRQLSAAATSAGVDEHRQPRRRELLVRSTCGRPAPSRRRGRGR